MPSIYATASDGDTLALCVIHVGNLASEIAEDRNINNHQLSINYHWTIIIYQLVDRI